MQQIRLLPLCGSALEALCDALYKCSTYLFYFSMTNHRSLTLYCAVSELVAYNIADFDCLLDF